MFILNKFKKHPILVIMELISVDVFININLKIRFSWSIDHILQKLTGFCVIAYGKFIFCVEGSYLPTRVC